MGSIKTFRDSQVWQKGHELVLLIYKITVDFLKTEIYALVSQMRRAAVLAISNIIVEGFKRRSVKDSINFYNMADASLEELKYQLLLSKDLKYTNGEDYKKTLALTEEVSKMFHALVKSQRTNASLST